MKALVLGVNGFCGRALATRLKEHEGAEVIGADMGPTALVATAGYSPLDVRDAGAVAALVGELEPDWIFNLAGVSGGDLVSQAAVNFLGTVNVLDAVRTRSRASCVITLGSAAEYGVVPSDANPVREEHTCRPVSPYGVSKHAATLAALSYAHQHGVNVSVMRPFNIVGPGVPETLVVGAVLARAVGALRDTREAVVRVGNLDSQRDFVPLADAVRAYALAAQAGCRGEIFNVCTGRPLRVRDVLGLALSFAPRRITLEVDPALFKPDDAPVVYGNPEKARRVLGFSAGESLESALQAAWTAAIDRG